MTSGGYKDWIVDDLMSDIDGITTKRMFGGWGIYQDGVIFSIITSGDRVYFKVDEVNRSNYEKAGSKPFTYSFKGKKKSVMMSYWELPVSVLEGSGELKIWIEKSVAASGRKHEK